MKTNLIAENLILQAVRNKELEIDSLGQVWRIAKRGWDRWQRQTVLRQCRRVRAEHRTPQGYLQLRIMVNRRRFYVGAHRIVHLCLIGPIPAGQTINHKNGQKWDNHPLNLETLTYSDNMKHAYRTGLKDEHGEKNPNYTLTNPQVEAIRTIYADGKMTQSALARMYDVTCQTISSIVRGKHRKNQKGAVADYTKLRQRSLKRALNGRYLS